MNSEMEKDILKVLVTEEELKTRIAELGEELYKRYEGHRPLFLGVLKGSFVFMADLMRAVTIPCSIDFLSVSSYGNGTASSGEVRILKDLDCSLEGKDLLIVEDILDSGMTLSFLLKTLSARNPASIRLCTFLDKPERRRVDIRPDYVGAEVPDKFIVGYGLDYAEKYRNLPYIGVLKPEVYEA